MVDGQATARNESTASLLARSAAEPPCDIPTDAADATDGGVIDDVVLDTASVPVKTANNIQVGAAKTTPGRAMDDTTVDTVSGSGKNSH